MNIKVEIETQQYIEDENPIIQKVLNETKGAVSDDGEIYPLIETIFNTLLGMGYSEVTLNKFIDKDGQI